MSKKKEQKSVAKQEDSISKRFIQKVSNEVASAVGGGIELSDSQKRLATNLFVKLDNDLEQAEADRRKKGKNSPEIVWKNINMQKLALDAAHRIQLGLDALVPNHLHTIPYLNGKTGKYDLDLRIGYKGKHHYRVKFSSDNVVDIRYELVHENDNFKPLWKDVNNDVEKYIFECADNPFNRGDVIGGFGYIEYENPKKNKLVLVTKDDFDKVKKAYTSGPVWKSDWEHRMQLKTVVHRTTEKLDVDTTKTNMSYHYVEAQDNPYGDEIDPSKAIEQPEEREEIDFDEETGELIDEKPETEPEPKPEPKDKKDLDDQVKGEGLPFN